MLGCKKVQASCQRTAFASEAEMFKSLVEMLIVANCEKPLLEQSRSSPVALAARVQGGTAVPFDACIGGASAQTLWSGLYRLTRNLGQMQALVKRRLSLLGATVQLF